MSNSTEHRKLAAIMFTDMVGYPDASGGQRNEQLALELLEEHRLHAQLGFKWRGIALPNTEGMER